MDALKHLPVCLLLLATLYCNVAGAQLSVTLVTDDKPGIANRMQEAMQAIEPGVEIDIASSSQSKQSKGYLVLLGQPNVTSGFAQAQGVISVFISEANAANVRADAYVFVEPPLERQIRLADLLVPGIKPMGLIVPAVQDKVALQNRLDKDLLNKLKLVTLEESGSLNQALFRGLKNSRALIGIYNTEIYNPSNIKNILITSYRQNKVLIGPSRAYLKAGSYATTFSDIKDIARRTIDIINTHQQSAKWPVDQYNPYFRILINKQVARSLNLIQPDIKALQTALEGAER